VCFKIILNEFPDLKKIRISHNQKITVGEQRVTWVLNIQILPSLVTLITTALRCLGSRDTVETEQLDRLGKPSTDWVYEDEGLCSVGLLGNCLSGNGFNMMWRNLSLVIGPWTCPPNVFLYHKYILVLKRFQAESLF
jgi:hypothetical protein